MLVRGIVLGVGCRCRFRAGAGPANVLESTFLAVPACAERPVLAGRSVLVRGRGVTTATALTAALRALLCNGWFVFATPLPESFPDPFCPFLPLASFLPASFAGIEGAMPWRAR